MAGKAAVPVKSPASCILPVADAVASGTAAVVMASVTNAVVAICVVFVPAVAVGANGVPVRVGDARSAFSTKPVVNTPSAAVALAISAVKPIVPVAEAPST
ncbi:hypothetical protein D3C86_1868500 [compost metagenome]